MQVIKFIFRGTIAVLLVIAAIQVADIFGLTFKVPETKNVAQKSSEAEIIRKQRATEEEKTVFEGTEEDIIALVNKARTEEGLGEVVKNEKLMLSAKLKALDMKEKGYFEHVSPEGLQPWFFVEKAGYRYKTVGENLAEGYFSAEEVHVAWMNSPGHRENILSDKYQELGVAIVEFEDNGLKSYLVVQHFGTQLKQEDLVVKTKCDLKSKQYCEEAEEKMDELEDVIKKQEKIIKDAKKNSANKKDIEKAEENLADLVKSQKDLDQYLAECDTFLSKCDMWE